MEPKLENINDVGGVLEFTLNGLEMSIANALRRTVLSDIPVVCIHSYPDSENKVDIETNTTRFNNEIIKQRLSCIPIHIADDEFPVDSYVVELDETNDTDTIRVVTTGDLVIRDIVNNKYLSESEIRKVFPANKMTGMHIDIVRLKPKISNDLPGESIKLTTKLSRHSAKKNGMYNVVSTCSYGLTRDLDKIESVWNLKEKSMKRDNVPDDEITISHKNFLYLDAERIYKQNSFDFTIETVGIYDNVDIVKRACDAMILKVNHNINLVDNDETDIGVSQSTIDNAYDIKLLNENQTLGKCLEYVLHEQCFSGSKKMSFVGFRKIHPHDDFSIIRVAYHEPTDTIDIKKDIISACNDIVLTFKKIKELF